MTDEGLFDAYRQVVSERDQLRAAGDNLWNELGNLRARWEMFNDADIIEWHVNRWEVLRGIHAEPPIEEFKCG